MLLLFQLALGTLGDKQFEFLQDSIGKRGRTKTTDSRSVHEVHRKGTCTDVGRSHRIELLECDTKYIEALLKESKDNSCFQIGTQELNLPTCDTNHNGVVCAALEDTTSPYYHVFTSCFDFYRSDGIYRFPSAGKCNSDCILALRRLSDQVGCCIHTSDYIAIVKTPSLWMNCGVERPEPCTDTPMLGNQPINIFSSLKQCSYKYSFTQYQYIYCKYLGKELSKSTQNVGTQNKKP